MTTHTIRRRAAFAALLLAFSPVFGGQETPAPAQKPPEAKAKTAAAETKPVEKKPEAAKKEPAAKEKEKEADKSGIETYTVKKQLFEIKVELDGVVNPIETTEIAIAPREWADLTIEEVVPHGQAVKKGDRLIRFDTEKLEEQIADLEAGAPLAELTLKMARDEAAALEKSTPLTLEAARRAKIRAEQDLAYFEDTGRAMRQRGAREELKSTENYLAYSNEELRQLEKMYQADDLTEETEEIILKRARDEVEGYTWRLEEARERTRRELDTLIPRESESLIHSAETQAQSWQQAEKGAPDNLRKKTLEIAAQERDIEKSQRKLRRLREDLAAMTVTAPHDGMVYYGTNNRGKWATASAVERKLVPGGKIMPREGIMTVVKPDPVDIRVVAPEAKMQHLEKGLEGVGSPVWNPEARFKTKVESLSMVPYADSTFDVTFSAPENGDRIPSLYPGMNVKIRLDVFKAEDALTLPKKAVLREDEITSVFMKDGEKRRVKLGRTDGEVYQALEGLKENDVVRVRK